MKLHIGYPATGLNKSIEIDDEGKLRAFYDKRMSHEVEGDSLGPEFKGYVFKITGGQDKQGFPMKQGVLAATRVKLLLNRGDVGFQAWRGRAGERRRKSVRGCIVGADLATLNLIIVKKGENDLPGLTDSVKELTRGPKRASKIRKLFNLSKDDDVRKFVVRHKKTLKKGKVITKAPKIQRLVTPERIHRKKLLKKLSIKRRQERTKAESTYKTLLAKRTAEKKAETQKRRKTILAQKRSQDQSNKSLKEKERAKIAAVNAARAEAKAAEDKANQAKAAAAAAAAAAQAAKKAEPKKAEKPAAAPAKAAKAEPKKDTKAAAPAPAKKDTKTTKAAEAKPTTSQPAKKSTKKSA